MAGTLLVTGATGSLGRRVCARAGAADWTVVGTSLTGPAIRRLDIRDRAAVIQAVRGVRPDAVIHAAVGRDRGDWRTTADGASHVAVAASEVGARLVHVSSDAVFSGRDVHYGDDAVPDPVNRYGAAKAAAETAVRAVDPAAAVVRTSLILGDGNGAHERLTHALASGRVRGALYTDDIRMPVHVDDLAEALLELVCLRLAGVLNVAGAEPVSRYDLGLLVAARDGIDPAAVPAARSAEQAPGRPLDVRLDSSLARSLLRGRLRGAGEFLR